MDLNILLWIGGMLFSLGIFALKVGLGLGYGKVRLKGVVATLTGYLVLFMVIALLAEPLVRRLEPILRKGPYLHIILAAGLIASGSYIIGSRSGNHTHTVRTGARLMLLLPCPVCLTAMTFSTWAALHAFPVHPLLVGLGLGSAFALLAGIVLSAARLRPGNRSEVSLGLAMVVIGLYLAGSMFLPGKIKEAKGMYASFILENAGATDTSGTWLLAILPLVLLIGFFAKSLRREL